MPIKSFKGKIANDTIDTIILHTNTGSIGYRIVKFQLMGISENKDYEATVKIFKIPQDSTTLSAEVDFSDNTLLAAGLYGDSTSGSVQSDQTIIFDNEIFNQDIYVCHKAASGTHPINYYIELEQVRLSLDENSVATLKDIRNIKQ
tara:strand:- start:1425 stop:1862 length:438 start_codon:yes stop_codon:yes gene_type:complete